MNTSAVQFSGTPTGYTPKVQGYTGTVPGYTGTVPGYTGTETGYTGNISDEVRADMARLNAEEAAKKAQQPQGFVAKALSWIGL